MSGIRAVVFDVYKTLIDIQTDEESLDSYLFLSRWLSYGVTTDPQSLRLRYLELCSEELSGRSDPYPDFDIGKVFAKILGNGAPASRDVELKSRELALLFRMVSTKSISIFPGVAELLRSLKKRVRLGIVSNAQHLFTIPELTKFNLIDLFDAIALSSDVGVRKPDSKIFHRLLQAMAVPPEAAVFVGDNLFDDVYGASNVGMKTVWIGRESGRSDPTVAGSAKPDYVVEGGSYETLSEILLSLF